MYVDPQSALWYINMTDNFWRGRLSCYRHVFQLPSAIKNERKAKFFIFSVWLYIHKSFSNNHHVLAQKKKPRTNLLIGIHTCNNDKAKWENKEKNVLIELFKTICKIEKYWGTWLTSEHWIELIYAAFLEARIFNFTKPDLNFAVSRDTQLKHCKVVFGLMSNN